MDMRREIDMDREIQKQWYMYPKYTSTETHMYKYTHLNFALSTCMCTCNLIYICTDEVTLGGQVLRQPAAAVIPAPTAFCCCGFVSREGMAIVSKGVDAL